MSFSKTHKYLTEQAFAPAPEIKVDVKGVNVNDIYKELKQKKACHDYPWQRYVSTLDKKNHSIQPLTPIELAQKEAFEAQMQSLIGALVRWAQNNYANFNAEKRATIINTITLNLTQFSNNIFYLSYVDDQTNDFFIIIKKDLEKIWLQLNNSEIELTTRQNIFYELCQNIQQCPAGVFYYIRSAADVLINPPSIKNWLRKLRKEILERIASQYLVRKSVISSMDVHVPIAFLQHAEKELGLNLGSALEKINDVHAKSPLTHLSHYSFKSLELEMEKEYTVQPVVNSLVTNIFQAIKDIIEKQKRDNIIVLEKNGWFSYDEGFIAQINFLLKDILELDLDANLLFDAQIREMAAGIKRRPDEKLDDLTPQKKFRTELAKQDAPVHEKKEREVKVKSEKITRQETYIRIAPDINQRLTTLLLEKSPHLFKQRPRLINDHFYYLDQYVPAAWFDLVEKEIADRKKSSNQSKIIRDEMSKLSKQKGSPLTMADMNAITQKVAQESKSKIFAVLAKASTIEPPAEFKNWESIAYEDQLPLFIAIIKQLCASPESTLAFIDYALTIPIPEIHYFMERLLTDDLDKFIKELELPNVVTFNVPQLEAPLKNRQEKLMEQLEKNITYLDCFSDNHPHESSRPGGHYLLAALKKFPDAKRIELHHQLFMVAYTSKSHTVPLLNDLMLREPYRSQLLPPPEWEKISIPRILIRLIENGANLEKLIMKAQKKVVRVVVINAIVNSSPKLLKTLLLQGLDWKAEFKFLTNPYIVGSLQSMLKAALTSPTADLVFAEKLITAGSELVDRPILFGIEQYNSLNDEDKSLFLNMIINLFSIQPQLFDHFFPKRTALEKSKERLLLSLFNTSIKLNLTTIVEKILLLKNDLAQVRIKIPPHSSVLLAVIEEGKIDIAKLLIKAGAPINLKNDVGQSPFSAAMKLKQTEVVKDLLLKNLDIIAELKSLKKEDADLVWTNLKIMLQEALMPPPDAAFVRKLMVVDTYLLDSRLPNDELPLMMAVKSGDEELAKLFISRSTNVTINAADNQGIKPLFLAAERGYKNIVAALIKAGANVESTDGVGMSALEVAAWHDHKECVDLLKKAGADKELLISRKGFNIENALKKGYSHATLQYMAQIMLNYTDAASLLAGNPNDPYRATHSELIPVLVACGAVNSKAEPVNEVLPKRFVEELIRLPAAEDVVKSLITFMSYGNFDRLFTPPVICRISNLLVMHFPTLNLRVVNNGAAIRYQLTKIREYLKSKPWMMIAPVIAFTRANKDSPRSIPLQLISEHLGKVNFDIVKFSTTRFFQAHMPAPNPQPNQGLVADRKPQRKL